MIARPAAPSFFSPEGPETQSSLHLHNFLLRGLVVDPDASVLPARGELRGVRPEVKGKDLIVFLLQCVQALPGSHVPMLDVAESISCDEHVLRLNAVNVGAELDGGGGQSDGASLLQIVSHSAGARIEHSDCSVSAAGGEELSIGVKFDAKYLAGIVADGYCRLQAERGVTG